MPFPNPNQIARAGLLAFATVIGVAAETGFILGVSAQTTNSPADPNILNQAGGLRGTASTDAAVQTVPGTEETPAFGQPDAATAASPQSDAAADDSPGSPNYGRPKPKKSQLFTPKSPLFTPDPLQARPLPPLVPYATAPGVKKRSPNSQAAVPPAPAPTVSVLPWTPPPPKLKREDNPFEPLGIDTGSLRLFPFVELGTGYDSNPNRLPSGVTGSIYARADAGLDVNSEWSEHSLTANLRGGYSDYFNFHEADRPDFQGKVDGRIDVLRDTEIDLEGRFTLDTQQPGSQQLAISGTSVIVGRPLIESYGTSLGATQRFGRLSVRLRGTYDRFSYQDATMSSGSELYLSENDYNDVGLNGHVAYELTPGIIPYADVTGDQRLYDSMFDSSGYERTSTGVAGKMGSTFEISRGLTGDLAGGYAERHYDDQRLIDAKGPTLDGSITWLPTTLDKATLSTATDFVETTLPGASAAISRRVSLQLSHSFFRNFTLTGIGTFQLNNYQGEPVTEHMYTGSLLAEYSLTRDIVLRATYRHERFLSTQLDSNYSADVFLLGVRLQR